MRAAAILGIVPVMFLALGEAAAQDPVECGPIHVPWSNTRYAASGDYMLTLSRDAAGTEKGVISGFNSNNSGFESQNGSVRRLKMDGDNVSFVSNTASFTLTIDDCTVTALTGQATHRLAGPVTLTLGK